VKKFKNLRPSPAMVVGFLALALALTGGAVAAKKKKKLKIPPNSISTKMIKDGAVTTPKLTPSERSEGFQTKQSGEIDLPTATETPVATLSLPAGGKYQVSAVVNLGRAPVPAIVGCTLKDDSTVLGTSGNNATSTTDYGDTASLIGFSDGGTVTVTCNPNNALKAKDRVITAVRVASLTG
jgi:hypothetical protein